MGGAVTNQGVWPRAIILVDMNAFFASVEQRERPEWRGRPVAITNGQQGTCIITCSYEARAYGVKTGMRIKQGRQLCPGLIQCPANPKRYAAASTAIMDGLAEITPDMEIFSVDEAFLDVTHCQSLLGPPEQIAQLAKRKVFEVSGLLCSAGLSGDKTTAKYAAKLHKPNGLTIIPPWIYHAEYIDENARFIMFRVPAGSKCCSRKPYVYSWWKTTWPWPRIFSVTWAKSVMSWTCRAWA